MVLGEFHFRHWESCTATYSYRYDIHCRPRRRCNIPFTDRCYSSPCCLWLLRSRFLYFSSLSDSEVRTHFYLGTYLGTQILVGYPWVGSKIREPDPWVPIAQPKGNNRLIVPILPKGDLRHVPAFKYWWRPPSFESLVVKCYNSVCLTRNFRGLRASLAFGGIATFWNGLLLCREFFYYRCLGLIADTAQATDICQRTANASVSQSRE